MVDSPFSPAAANRESALRAEKLRVLFNALPVSIGTTLLLSLITGIVLWNHRSHAELAIWLLAQSIVGGWRLWLRHSYMRCKSLDSGQTLRYYRGFLASAMLAGCVWGSSAAMLFPLDEVHGIFIVFMIAGVCSAAAVGLGADQRTAYAFIIPAIAPLVILLFNDAGPAAFTLGMMTVAYCGLLALNARRAHQQFAASFASRREADESQAEVALARAQMEAFVNYAPAAVAMFDRDLRYIAHSQRWLIDYNLEGQSLIGRSHYEVFPEVPDHWKAIHQRCLAGIVARCEEDPFERADGTIQWLRWEDRPWRDAQGNIGGIVMLTEDITARRMARDALNAQHELLRKLSDRVPGMIFQSRRYPDGRSVLQYTSEGIRDVYEIDPQAACADSSLTEARIVPEDRERMRPGLREAFAEGRLWSGDFRVVLPKRGPRWLHGEATPEPQPDGSVLLYGYITDITDRKNTEEHLRVLSDRMEIAAQSLEIGVWDLNLKTGSYVLSDRIYEIYGSPRGSFTDVETELMRRIHPDDRRRVVTRHRAAIANASRFDAEFRITRPDRQQRVIRSTALVVVDETGSPTRMTGVNWDITELKKAERMKSEFVSTVSHELRTPLTSIQGSLGLLCGRGDGKLPDNAMKLIDVARRNSDRLVRLINDLLDMEKIEAGKLHFEISRRQVMPLIQQALEENAGYAVAHQVRFELTHCAADAHAMVDAHRFQQVMANLLSNAAKFSPPGAVIEVSAALTERGLRVEVRDQGSGISDAFRPSIFQMFCQADSTDARSKGGTGLGLAICKAIIEGMGGHIGFDTEVVVGALFYFELPSAPPEPTP